MNSEQHIKKNILIAVLPRKAAIMLITMIRRPMGKYVNMRFAIATADQAAMVVMPTRIKTVMALFGILSSYKPTANAEATKAPLNRRLVRKGPAWFNLGAPKE